MAFLIAALLAIAYSGTLFALVHLSRRDIDVWLRVAWTVVILAFPFFGLLAYGTVGGAPNVLKAWRRSIAVIVVSLCFAWFLWYVRDLTTPFLIAFFLAALLDPLVSRLQRQGASRTSAVTSIYLVFFLGIALLGVLIAPRVIEQIGDIGNNLTQYTDQVSDFTQRVSTNLDQWYARNETSLQNFGIAEPPSKMLSDKTGPVALGVRHVLGTVQVAALGLFSQALWLVIIPLSLFYFLLDFQRIRAKLISMVPEEYRAHVDRVSHDTVEIFSAYLRSLAIVCFCYGAAATLLFTLFRLRYSLFLGIGAGVLYAVPYVGPLLAVSAAVLVALVVMQTSVGYALLIVAVFLLMHFTFDYGITPRMVGGSLGLHPVVNIFALMCGATLFGAWGMLLAVPVAASVQMLLFYFFPGLKAEARSRESRVESRE